ncbi:MAG: aminotransferase class IV [Lysobacterales bacterium]
MVDPSNRFQALVDGKPALHIPLTDRGLLYGDGLFETLRFVNGAAPLWYWHMQRLNAGAARLRLNVPTEALLLRECQKLAGTEECVIRVIITRGDGTKPGYRSAGKTSVRRVVMLLAMPPARKNLRVGICSQSMSDAGATAGMKHLARLEQVLLASEEPSDDWDEGLVFNGAGLLCEALQANVLVLSDGQWLTPPVGSGVLGATRAALLSLGWVKESRITRTVLDNAQALALCNAVRGIEPVAELINLRFFDTGPAERLSRSWRTKLASPNADSQSALAADATTTNSRC